MHRGDLRYVGEGGGDEDFKEVIEKGGSDSRSGPRRGGRT